MVAQLVVVDEHDETVRVWDAILGIDIKKGISKLNFTILNTK